MKKTSDGQPGGFDVSSEPFFPHGMDDDDDSRSHHEAQRTRSRPAGNTPRRPRSTEHACLAPPRVCATLCRRIMCICMLKQASCLPAATCELSLWPPSGPHTGSLRYSAPATLAPLFRTASLTESHAYCGMLNAWQKEQAFPGTPGRRPIEAVVPRGGRTLSGGFFMQGPTATIPGCHKLR